MAFIRRVRTASGATAVQIAEYANGRQRIVRHLGSAHSDAELGVLQEQARDLLGDPSQGEFDLGVEPAPRVAGMVAAPAEQGALELPAAVTGAVPVLRDEPGRVVATESRLVFEALASVYTALGFDSLGDLVFRDLVIARIVEATSLLDSGRVLTDLGRRPASYATMKRTLGRAKLGRYRDTVAKFCFNHAVSSGDVSLCLYDVTTLYFEAEKEDDLRKVGFSKERRVDPQIVVGLLVDRHGFPLEIGCFEGNQAENATMIAIIKDFQARHDLVDMVVVADAGMLSASNLTALEEAGLRFIVGSRSTKAPADLESHFRWHGDAFEGGQIIDTITPKNRRVVENDANLKAEPVWDPAQHPASWRAVWAYSTKRAVRDNKTLTLQENRAREVVEGEKSARSPRSTSTAESRSARPAPEQPQADQRSISKPTHRRSRTMNTVTTFAGNLTADPELRSTTTGTPVLEIRVAVNRRIRGGEAWKDAPPTFHSVKVWGPAAEHVAESLVKGDRVLVHGTVETEAWEAEGQDRSRDVVVVSERSGEIGTSLRFATSRPAKTPKNEARNES